MEKKIINNQNQINQSQIIDEKDYEIYVSNQSKEGFDDLHYFNWCQQTAFKYWQAMQQSLNQKDSNGYLKNGRKWQDFFFDNGNGINFDGVNKVDLSVPIPANLNYTNIFREFYWSVCENMRLFADDVSYYLWLRIYKKHIESKLEAQKFNDISELKNKLDNAFKDKDNVSWQNFIEKLKESRITFANIYDETHTQELFKSFNKLYKSMPNNIQKLCVNIGKERFLLLLRSLYANFLDFNGKEHEFQNDINLDDKIINKNILEARKQVKLCSALYKLFIKDKIEYWKLDNGKIACLRNNDLLKYAQESKDGSFYSNDVKMRTGWNNLQNKPLGKLDEKVRNVTWMNYANWDFQDFDGINGRLPGYYDRNENFIEGEWRWFSEQFDVMINYYDSDVNDLCDWIHTNQDINRKLSMPLVGNKNLGSSCYFNAANVSELGNPINLMFNFKLGHAVLISKDSKSNLSSYGKTNLFGKISDYADDFFVLNDIYKDSYAKFQDNDLKAKYNYNLSYVHYVRLIMDVHLLNIKSKSNTEVAISAKNLRESLKLADKQFDKNEANDSKDLLNFNHEWRHTLHTFDNGIIEPMGQNQTNCAVVRNNFLNFYFVNNRSYISSSMYGVTVRSIICKDNHQSYGAQIDNPYNSLDVLISYKQNFIRLRTKGQTPMLTLWELLNNFNQPQKLTGNNQSFCSPCKKLVDATQNSISYNIFEHKSHVTLHINRGKNKINHANVAVPEIVKSGSNYFCLSSIVEHRGSSGESGHYLCFLNCYADGWNFYDDSSVTHQPNGFGDVFQNTYTLNNSSIGHVYQYTKIGPTEYLYLKNNEVIAIPSKNGKNNKFIRGAEAHCLRRAIKYFCQSHNDGNDIDIYESNGNRIKSELAKIVVYQYTDGKDKNKLVTVTLLDYFQYMELNLIFPYIFQLYERNWDTWNQYEVNHEKLEPEPLCSSYEYGLCCLLIGKWNKQNFQLTPVQESVYDAINKKIPSLQINNLSQLAFNSANQSNNIKINDNSNTIKQEKNFTSNSQNKINVANNININDKFSANNQDKINQINNVIGVKDKNGNESEIVTENKIQKETNQAINNINETVYIKSENASKNFNTNGTNKNEIFTEIDIQTIENKNFKVNNSKTENRENQKMNNDNNRKTEIEIPDDKHNLSEKKQENENSVVKEEIKTNANEIIENENKKDMSKIFEQNKSNDKKTNIVNKIKQINLEKQDTNKQQFQDNNSKHIDDRNNDIVTDEMKEINSSNTKPSTRQIQNKNAEHDKNKINTSNPTLERNKKTAIALIIIGAVLLVPAIIVLLYEIYVAAIILLSISFVVAVIGIIFMIKVHFMKNNSELKKLSEQPGIDHDKTLTQYAQTQIIGPHQQVISNSHENILN